MTPGWQADHTTRGALALITGLTTLMCLPDHFDYSTWPFTNGYMLLYGAALLVIWRMRPAGEGARGLAEDALSWSDLSTGMRRARILTAGLAVVLGIVRGHRGAIRVEDEPGGGTRFRALFPAPQNASPVVAREIQNAPRWHGSGTVLVIEDEHALRMLA